MLIVQFWELVCPDNVELIGKSLVSCNGEIIHLGNPVADMIVQGGGGIWFRPPIHLIISYS